MRFSRAAGALLWLGALGACQAAAGPPLGIPPAPLTDAPVQVAQAETLAAPALLAAHDRVVVAWPGADVQPGVRLLARAFPVRGAPTPPVDTALARGLTRDLSLWPGGAGRTHLLWLDAAPPASGVTLVSAALDDSLGVWRGPNPLAEGPALCYDALPTPDGGLWVAWAGGPLSEPTLRVAFIDADGRPRPATRQTVAGGMGCPAFLPSGGGAAPADLLWTARDGTWVRARFAAGAAEGLHALGTAPPATAGDFRVGPVVAAGPTWALALWHITDAAGGTQVWASETRDGTFATWAAPRPLRVAIAVGGRTATPYQPLAGGRDDDDHGGVAVMWATPLRGVHTALPIALVTEDGLLHVALWTADGPLAAATVGPVGALGGPPSLAQNGDGQLVVGWATPTLGAPATLWAAWMRAGALRAG